MELENKEDDVKQNEESQAGTESTGTPEESVEAFATDIADKATAVASGDMTPEDFVTEVTASVDTLSADVGGGNTPSAPVLNGLGGNSSAPLDLGKDVSQA